MIDAYFVKYSTFTSFINIEDDNLVVLRLNDQEAAYLKERLDTALKLIREDKDDNS